MSSGVTRVVTGAVVGTGAALSVATVGFKPRVVELINLTGLVEARFVEGMTEGRGVKRVTGGTLSQIAADAGITPTEDGFDLGTDADVNVDGETLHYVCHE